MEGVGRDFVDFRSDTVTRPTDEMRRAMFEAKVGDDVYGDDSLTVELELMAAAAVKKEAALFVPSGTFGNQLAIRTHTHPGDEVIADEDCHIVQHEVGACGALSGVNLRCIKTEDGLFDVRDVESRIRTENIHYPKTGLICMENAHSNGKAFSLERMRQIYSMASKYSIPVHLDGARIFNASAAIGVEAFELAGCCDSVMFCLSKGLCAPIGSMLAGTSQYISRARKNRKLMGGGMRQTGILAAAGMIAISRMRFRLAEDHENAHYLSCRLAEIPGIAICKGVQNINMTFFDISGIGSGASILVSGLREQGILCNPDENGMMRFVTHNYVTKRDIDHTIECMKIILKL